MILINHPVGAGASEVVNILPSGPVVAVARVIAVSHTGQLEIACGLSFDTVSISLVWTAREAHRAR